MKHAPDLHSLWPVAAILMALALGLCSLAAAAEPATATAPAPSAAEIKLQLTTEEGKKQIQATVTAGGKPVEGATVAFFARRSFGRLQIGKDTTLDDGTAQAAFPADLPGDAAGRLDIIAVVQAPTKFSQATARATFAGAAVLQESQDAFPRALWAPRAPWLLLVALVGIVASVWCVYAYVLAQLWAIYRGR